MSSDPLPSPVNSSTRRRLDLFGIGIAGLCAIHCLATIIIVSGLGVGSHFLLAPEIHEFGLIAAIVIAALAIGWGVARHRRAGPLLIAGLGLATMTVALIVGHGMEEAVLTIMGVAMVSIGHWMNLRGTS